MAPSDYESLSDENKRRYGTDIGRIGPMLLADRYDDRTHFIFELLQNAEDAIGRRGDASGPRKVTFTLTPGRLTLSHFGRPFDEADVRGVCGIAESTKDKHSIGRFGIGFKSVYTFTSRPEVHSGDEDFAIENYVQPKAVERSTREPGETHIILPLRPDDPSAEQEIEQGFQRLGAGALLFLQHIDEINWSVAGGASGLYLRGAPVPLGPNVQRITLIGQDGDQTEVDQHWLVFHSEVATENADKVGRVEVAFSLARHPEVSERWTVQPIAVSPLVVFFPTVVSTNLGFLVQGPYRTTPSRDNIPRSDPWNQGLVKQTAGLVIDAVRWMRDNDMLDTTALRCLPTDRTKFSEGAMFAAVFDAVRQAFLEEALLPRFDGGFVSARQARLARTQELRELFSAEQVALLFGTQGSAWLSGDITQDKAPELRRYLLQELKVPEVTPEQIVPRLGKEFLEAQTDEWIARLYGFLDGQKALSERVAAVPLVRLDNGTHVVARVAGRALAFLPSAIETSFPTVRRTACATPAARSFLISLGLTEPDPVDDVIWNVLPKYKRVRAESEQADYAEDITRILKAFDTDSKAQREKLLGALREAPFVQAVDTGSGKRSASRPGNVYIATDRLKALFAGVDGVLVVDDEVDSLRGEPVRDLLVACGASRYLAPKQIASALSTEELFQMRVRAGLERATWAHPIEDFTVRGLSEVLGTLNTLPPEEARARAEVLWDALADLEGRGTGSFYGTYRWGFSQQTKTVRFDAAFVQQLRRASWIPDATGDLVRPELMTFDSLGWKPNPFLLDRIAFKPPIIDQLAKQAGIEPAALDLLRKLGITSLADLARMGIASRPAVSPRVEDTPGGEPHSSDTNASAAEDAPDLPDENSDEERTDTDSKTPSPSTESDRDTQLKNKEDDEPEDANDRETEARVTRAPRQTSPVVNRQTNATTGQRRRKVTGRDGLAEQAARLGRRITAFFGEMADAEDDEDVDSRPQSSGWQARLVCLDVAAGGLQLEIGPLGGLPSFVKKLRVVGTDWDALVLAANARLRATRTPVRPGTGPWRWEAVGFEEEQDLELDKLALNSLGATEVFVFRLDADGAGRPVVSKTLSPGQTYRLLLPPGQSSDLGVELDAGWRIWSLDLATPFTSSTRELLVSLGLGLGESWPRLEWAVVPASSWRSNARGESYPIFESGTELFVNLSGVSLEEGDDAAVFMHGPSTTEQFPVTSDGLVSLGKPAAGRWACALMHSRTSVQTTTLVFEVSPSGVEHVSAMWAVSAPTGLVEIEATAPPGWPVSLRWSGLASKEESLATLYADNDRNISFERVHPLLLARAARTPVADVVIDFRELGRRLISHDARANLAQLREQVSMLWKQRADLVQARSGAWQLLMPGWFEPVVSRLGYGVEALTLPTDMDAPHDLAAWLLTIDEREKGTITRSPSRVLVLTTHIDSVMSDQREWIDAVCTAAKVRDAIVTDGTRWTCHRKGDRQINRRGWNLDHAAELGIMDEMLNDLTEGL